MWLSLFSTFLSTTAGISKVYLFKYEGHSRKSEKNVEKNQTNNKKGKKEKKNKTNNTNNIHTQPFNKVLIDFLCSKRQS